LAQNNSSSENYYNWFDNIIGVNNTSLLNGIEFKEEYRTLENNSQYFFSNQFLPGDLIYNGQPYYDVDMKYDIYEDQLIIRLVDNSGYFAIKLIKELVESFQIGNHLFLNSSYLQSKKESQSMGFCEVLYQTQNISFFKKHLNNKQERRNDRFAYTQFIYRKKILFSYGDKFYELSSKKDLINTLPDQKKTINSFYKNKTFLMRSNYEEFLKKLCENLNENVIKN
jgi:hypothetical protein